MSFTSVNQNVNHLKSGARRPVLTLYGIREIPEADRERDKDGKQEEKDKKDGIKTARSRNDG